jgi:hypothetical protein
VGVRQGPRPWPDRLGNMGQGPRVQGIRLGQRPGGFGKVTRLTGIDHHHGAAGRGERGDHGPLVAPGGFEHNQRGM